MLNLCGLLPFGKFGKRVMVAFLMQTLIENIIISSFKFIAVKIKICYFFILSTSFGNDLYGIYLLCSPFGHLFICEFEST